MKPVSVFGIPFSISIVFWTIVGLLRAVTEQISRVLPVKSARAAAEYGKQDIAVIVPAHNEELVIGSCLKALIRQLKPQQVHVASDGSVDSTAEIARALGVNVTELNPGRGKARALKYLINHYRLYKHYKIVCIIDADTEVRQGFFTETLKVLNSDNDITVVWGNPQLRWPRHFLPRRRYYYMAYLDRLARYLEVFLAYGQTWKYTNVYNVVPGFAAVYRSEILRQLEIDTPGLLIEDFNLAFQLHRKNLGKIAFSRKMRTWDQHPDNLRDYWGMVRRWNIGFFQTIRKNGFWPSFFWLSLGIYSLEVLLGSLLFLTLPLVLFLGLAAYLPNVSLGTSFLSHALLAFGVYGEVTVFDIYLLIYIFDYAITAGVAVFTKKPKYLIYGIFFFIMHFVVALALLSSIYPGFFKWSAGRWKSPTRRAE